MGMGVAPEDRGNSFLKSNQPFSSTRKTKRHSEISLYIGNTYLIAAVGQGPTVAVPLAKHPEPCSVPQQVPQQLQSLSHSQRSTPSPSLPRGHPLSAAGPCPAVLRHGATRGYADARSKVDLPPSCIASQKKLNLSRNLLGVT